MTRQELKNEVLNLPIEDQMDLMEDILQGVEGRGQGLDITPEQRKEAIRRLAEYEKNPASACTWEEFVARARKLA